MILFALRLPSNRKKVDTELGRAKLEIESKLVAQGPNVTRHVSLPATGQSPEWILEEMTKMDAESGGTDGWKHGKVSGAVYRTLSVSSSLCMLAEHSNVHQTAVTT